MYTSKLLYKIFKIDNTAEARVQNLSSAVSEITPRYFKSNPRFKGLGNVSSPALVDYMIVYEEGDAWELTIVRVLDKNGLPKYVFLPMVEDIVTEKETKIGTFVPLDLGDVAFGREAFAEWSGKMNLIVVDAFSDFGFMVKLLNLFLPWENLEMNHANAYTEITESGEGKFTFHSSSKFEQRWEYPGGVLPKLLRSGVISLKYSAGYRLNINGILPEVSDLSLIQSAPNYLGCIAYSGPQTADLLIGILEEMRPGEHLA